VEVEVEVGLWSIEEAGALAEQEAGLHETHL
jgi:hypothetical protein